MKTEAYHYDPTKEIVLLPGKIQGPTSTRNIRLVFDPGSFRTILSTELTDSIGYQTTGLSKIVTTSSVVGKEYGYTITVSLLKILGFEFHDIEVATFDLPPKYDIDGLVGLDLLERFEVILKHRERFIQFKLLDDEE